MKSTELRIGNLVRNNLSGEILKPCDILCDVINTDKIEGLNYGFIEPIPLTEEWLLKFGFKWKGLIAKGRYLTLFTPCGKAIVYKESHFIFTGVTIEVQTNYVHQLQNLYFALTGKELILNA
jgi:hypothetical protein